jgi:hypothetical protein
LLSTIVVVFSFVTVPVGEASYGYIETDPNAAEVATAEAAIEEGQDIERIVRTYFEDIPVMAEIASCESHFRHTLSDGSVLRGRVDSADTGVMQINLRYHGSRAEKLGYDLHDLYDNMAYARTLYEEQGTQPWSASRACWRHTLAQGAGHTDL